MICGLIIETTEIDGFMVPQPNPSSSLNEENAQYQQSCVPYSAIIPGTTTSTQVRHREVTSDDFQKVSISFYDMTTNRLPQFDASVAEATIPATLDGFSRVEHIGWLEAAWSMTGFKTGNRQTVKIPKNFIRAWSPYRYVLGPARPNHDNTYMLLNLRTIFGTNPTLAETRHPSTIIPSA